MIYLGNGMYSDSGYLSHGGPWKTHKYIAIQNGRYVYPDDKNPVKKKTWKDGPNIKVPGVVNLDTRRLPDKRENGPTLNTNPSISFSVKRRLREMIAMVQVILRSSRRSLNQNLRSNRQSRERATLIDTTKP